MFGPLKSLDGNDPGGIIARILGGGQQGPAMGPPPIAPAMTGSMMPTTTNRKTGPLDAIFARQK